MPFIQHIGLRLLELSRAYYYPVQTGNEADPTWLSEETYAEMLCEIDAFSQQFQPATTRQ